MRIQNIKLHRFKRFSDTTIGDIPESAKLVIMAGPNGCGKSSVIDAMYVWYRHARSQRGGPWDIEYHVRQDDAGNLSWNNAVDIKFWQDDTFDTVERKKGIYIRSAYRNDPSFRISGISHIGPAIDEDRIQRTIDNDAAVSKNYQRMCSQGFQDIYENEEETTTIGEFRDKQLREIRANITFANPRWVR